MNNIHNWLFQKQLAEDLQGGTAPNPMVSPMAPPQMQPRITVQAPDNNVGMMDNMQPTPMRPTGSQFPLPDVQPRQAPQPSPWDNFKAHMSDFGSGLSSYTKRLFNDPARMALLQGGLSMIDPNTYYDQQGFGSPWTGLRAGLGAAQQGMQGVYDRRIDQAKASMASMPQARDVKVVSTAEGAKGFDITQYTQLVNQGMDKDQARMQSTWQLGDSAGSIKAKQASAQFEAIDNMFEGILSGDQGLIDITTVGPLAPLRILGEALSDWSGQDWIEPRATELRGSLDLLQAMLWKDLVGSGQISRSDYEFLEKILGSSGWTDSPQIVRDRITRVRDFLRAKRKPVGSYDNSAAMIEKSSPKNTDPLGLGL